MTPPWNKPFPADWLVYADWCLDHGDLPGQLRALRFAVGLQKRPKLILVANVTSLGSATAWQKWFQPGELWPSGSVRNMRWFVPREAHHIEKFAATPLDFPGMADEQRPKAGHPLREFCFKASYDVRPFRDPANEHIYYRDRKRQMIKIV